MNTDSINHRRPNRSTKRTKCGVPKLPTYPLGTFRSAHPDGKDGKATVRKMQFQHQKAANIRANGLPIEIVDTKPRSRRSPMARQSVLLGSKSVYTKLCALK